MAGASALQAASATPNAASAVAKGTYIASKPVAEGVCQGCWTGRQRRGHEACES
jgi:hypothetical protein